MLTELQDALSSFNALFEIAKGLKGMNDAQVRERASVELLEKLVGAHTAQLACAKRVDDLEKEVARLKDWSAEKQRYQLAKIGPGSVAYLLKRAMAAGAVGHALCANCYERGTKSYLQGNGKLMIREQALVCGACDSTLKATIDDVPEFAD